MAHPAIRPLTPTDRDAVLALLADDGGYAQRVHGRPAGLADAEDLLTARPPGVPAERKHTLGAWDGEELVGVADVIDGWPEPGTAYIGLLQLRGDAQGRGFARTLHEALLARVPRATAWQLGVVDTNAQAVGFWEHLGYRRTGEERPWTSPSGARRTVIVMESPATGAR